MNHRMLLIAVGVSALAVATAPPFLAQVAQATPERVDAEINARIRKEAQDNSKIMRTMHYLTDVYGPRLTGSPNHKAAAEWAVKQMTEWGFSNGHLEPWDFGHPGWLNERFSGFILAPVRDSLVGEVLAWTPSTNGTVTGDAVQIVPPQQPLETELAAWISETSPGLKGRIVLVGRPVQVPVTIEKAALRRDDEALRRQYDPDAPPQAGRGGRGRGGPQQPPREGALSANAVNERIDAMLVSAGAIVRINDAGRDHGQIRAFNNRTFDVAKAVPTVVLRNEDYGRISRLLADNLPVRLEFTIVNRTYPEGSTSYNAIAEIPGTDKKDEVVMLGGHLDSWHSATGATDNAKSSQTAIADSDLHALIFTVDAAASEEDEQTIINTIRAMADVRNLAAVEGTPRMWRVYVPAGSVSTVSSALAAMQHVQSR